jgi:hypothetical protein
MNRKKSPHSHAGLEEPVPYSWSRILKAELIPGRGQQPREHAHRIKELFRIEMIASPIFRSSTPMLQKPKGVRAKAPRVKL